MTSTGHRTRLALAVLVSVGLAAVACTSSDRSGNSAASTSPAKGLGTPIDAGLDVQPGSHLLGTVFPLLGATGVETGRVALIAVDGDPADVTSYYQQALTKLGYRFASATCGDEPPNDARRTCEVPGDSSTIESGAAYLELAGPRAGRPEFATTLYLSMSPRSAAPEPSLEGSVLRSAPGTIVTAAQVIPRAGVRAVDVASVRVPGIGDRVAARSIDGDARAVVVEGSELLAPAVPINGGKSGWTAVAKVTGDPIEVADDYLHQRVWDSVISAHRTSGPPLRIEGNASVAGGPYLDLLLVPADPSDAEGAWWMLITATFD